MMPYKASLPRCCLIRLTTAVVIFCLLRCRIRASAACFRPLYANLPASLQPPRKRGVMRTATQRADGILDIPFEAPGFHATAKDQGDWGEQPTQRTVGILSADNKHKAIRNREVSRAASVASSILRGLRSRKLPPPRKLNIVTDFYDRSTGLHSEGVWHNCMAGIASLSLQRAVSMARMKGSPLAITIDEEEREAPQRIAASLWKFSWDGASFRRRSRSGGWDHSPLDSNAESIEQATYYRPSQEHRCVQHGMAVIFYSMLLLQGGKDEDLARRFNEIADSFLKHFWDDDVGRWTTVSDVQGGGTLSRPSASSGRSTEGADGAMEYYYRAVDQAIGILACLAILQILPDDGNARHPNDKVRRLERRSIIRIVRRTCRELFAPDGFGYGATNEEEETTTRSYMGLTRNRNFWHDGWVALALVCARNIVEDRSENEEDNDSSCVYGEEELQALFTRLLCRYGRLKKEVNANVDKDEGEGEEFDGTVWHWARSQKDGVHGGNVRYCGDNALLYAIARELDWAPGGLKPTFIYDAFWDFVDELRRPSKPGEDWDRDKGLASVADVYPQVRLHPNTELAALVLWSEIGI